MINRIVAVLMAILMIMPICVSADNVITLKVDSQVVTTDVPPVIVSDRTLIPARAVFENLGAKIIWDEENYEVNIAYKTNSLKLYIGETKALLNNKAVTLDVPAQIVNSRTMIPVRFVAENFGFGVNWDDKSYTVNINSPKVVSPTYNLSAISIKDTDTQSIITVKGVGKIAPQIMKLQNPNRIVFDFEDSNMSAQIKTIDGNGKFINTVRTAQYEPTVCRVVVDVTSDMNYTYKSSGSDFIITFGQAQTKPSGGSNYISSVKLDSKAKGKLVIIDAGHGGSEVGTIGKKDGKDIYEKNINLKISLMLNEMLKNNGVSTYMIRDDDSYVDINQRPIIGNQQKGYLYLSVHNNASTSTETRGVQIYYSDSTASFDNITNKAMANIYYENIAKLGLRKAGTVDNPRYIVIYKSNMPSIIIENAFVSNPDDLDLLLDDTFLEKLAKAICDSTITTLNKSVK